MAGLESYTAKQIESILYEARAAAEQAKDHLKDRSTRHGAQYIGIDGHVAIELFFLEKNQGSPAKIKRIKKTSKLYKNLLRARTKEGWKQVVERQSKRYGFEQCLTPHFDVHAPFYFPEDRHIGSEMSRAAAKVLMKYGFYCSFADDRWSKEH